MQRYGLIGSLLLLCLGLALSTDSFLTVDNLLNVLRQASINGIISIGMMLVILTRGIDLSVGSVLALATIVAADMLTSGILIPLRDPALAFSTLQSHDASAMITNVLTPDAYVLGFSPLGAIVVALLVGALAGMVSGALVTYINIPPFIATLGMMTFARGAALLYAEGQPISDLGELGAGFRYLGSAELGQIPVPVVVMLLVYLLAYLILNQTAFGRYIYALGNNQQAAFLSGLPVRRVLLFVYAAAGLLAALAGVILAGRIDSAQPSAGAMFEFDAIAAVVVGGTSFSGGEGTVWGTLIGVLIIAVLDNGLNLLGVSSFYQDIAKGAVIALALLLYKAIR